jgi:alpha-galactosidase
MSGNISIAQYRKGVYELMEKLTEKYPDILFGGCFGGGGRFDLGMLFFMPQYWTSNNTDAVERAFIQEGTSIFFPQIAMGAHVSAVPNHQTGRITPLSMRYTLAAAGNLGYELDPLTLSEGERKEIKDQLMARGIEYSFSFGERGGVISFFSAPGEGAVS